MLEETAELRKGLDLQEGKGRRNDEVVARTLLSHLLVHPERSQARLATLGASEDDDVSLAALKGSPLTRVGVDVETAIWRSRDKVSPRGESGDHQESPAGS